jgi:hypothetical protein
VGTHVKRFATLTSGFSQHVKQKFVYEVPTACPDGRMHRSTACTSTVHKNIIYWLD